MIGGFTAVQNLGKDGVAYAGSPFDLLVATLQFGQVVIFFKAHSVCKNFLILLFKVGSALFFETPATDKILAKTKSPRLPFALRLMGHIFCFGVSAAKFNRQFCWDSHCVYLSVENS